ncbi:helix-hairpin-helix domain-containing protein [Actinomadura sp. DC4]|uniref:ComEA family DNA-binding protein n=1 Tax=Actinomadura sp. DC4 TaxID=3055069 RepID=UPI0025B006BF|nr:helix-hairpin-helix domain-containing protein [Actinomadura sp. DC4]MDN3356002.1 helix-hairpin-helix domain-containing protein [Actinomadura sp. DC4]
MVPLLTGGFGAPASFLYAALCRRSASLGGAAVLYSAGVIGGCAGLVEGNDGPAVLGLLLLILTWTLSTVHALVARPRLYPPTTPRDQMNQRAVEMARHRRSLREAARKVVSEDPVLARELRIGRPDLLPRSFDDGGLVDVNHVTPEVLSRLPGLTYEMVDRIMQVRTHSGGFVSAEELVVHCDLPPSVVSEIAEYALFTR